MTESNIFAHIYNALLTKLSAEVLNADNSPVFRFVAQDFGQLEVSERPAVTFPCLLIDFEAANYSDASPGVQIGDGVLLLRLCTDPYSADMNLVSSDVRAKALTYYDYEAKLHIALQNWSDNSFGGFTRISANTEKRDDALRVRQIRYSFGWKDDSALQLIHAGKTLVPEVTGEIDLHL